MTNVVLSGGKALKIGSGVFSSGTGGGGGITFNFFMSPGGDDNNVGSLASPWSLTAFNTKQSTYRGTNIGLIGDQGTFTQGNVGGTATTLYALLQAATDNTPVLKVDGGTPSNPTYIASCNSSGSYVRGLAVIDCSNPSGGAHPTTDGAQLIGQCGDSGTQVPHPDNVTFDGIAIQNFSFSAITMQSASTVMTNVVIKNCEFSGSNNSATNNNPGCIRIDRNSLTLTNCKFHDCASTSGGSFPAYPPLMAYTSTGVVITNCTVYNMVGFQQKDSNQDATISYCYIDYGTFGNSTAFGASYFEGVTGTGRTTTIHHCILLGPIYLQGGVPSAFSGDYQVYNNTFHVKDLTNPLFYWPTPNASGTFHAYNNVCTEQGGTWTNGGQYGVAKATNASTVIQQFDFNYYLSSPQFCPSGTGGSLVSLASWQALGFDTHSNTGGLPFASTPSALNMNSFALNTSSAAYTGGIGGAICGAIDGSGSIGCNF